MSEGENKFLKLAWNTSQEKPSASQTVMKQTPEQGVSAGEGRQAAHHRAPCHGVGQRPPAGRISPSGKYTLSPPNAALEHPKSAVLPPFICHREVTVLRVDSEEEGFKLGEFYVAGGLIAGCERA